MNATQRELLRNTLLTALEAAGPYAMTCGALRIVAKTSGHNVTEDDIKFEIQYLEDAGFVAATAKAISPENKRYRITGPGRNYLATEGLA